MRENLVEHARLDHRPYRPGRAISRRAGDRRGGASGTITAHVVIRRPAAVRTGEALALGEPAHGGRHTGDVRRARVWSVGIHAAGTVRHVRGCEVAHVRQWFDDFQIHARPRTGVHDRDRPVPTEETRRLGGRIHGGGQADALHTAHGIGVIRIARTAGDEVVEPFEA